MTLRNTLFLLLTVVFRCITTQDYCSICKDHTMCIYKGVGPACAPLLSSGVGPEDLAAILKTHNDLRQRVALGQEKLGAPGPQPPAANMRMLSWDAELATVAQRLADQCKYGHDSCRNVARFGVGQNIAWVGGASSPDWNGITRMWYGEVQDYSNQDVAVFKFGMHTGHYTALVWATTYLVGCGYSRFRSNSSEMLQNIYVCNYAPVGNVMMRTSDGKVTGMPLYQVGRAASQCPTGTSSSKDKGYPGLCS